MLLMINDTVMYRDLVQVSENHFCQAVSSWVQLSLPVSHFQYHCPLPSRPGSLGSASRLRGQGRWGAFPGPGIIHLFLADHLIIDKRLVKSVPLFQLSHGSPLLSLGIHSGLAFSLSSAVGDVIGFLIIGVLT